MKYYHATDINNMINIVYEGIKTGIDGCVYLAKTKEDAMKFIAIRTNNDIIVFEVELNENNVEESYDHNEQFFKCKAYYYSDNIPKEKITGAFKFPAI